MTFGVPESDGREEGESHSVSVGERLLERGDGEELSESLEMDADVLLGVRLWGRETRREERRREKVGNNSNDKPCSRKIINYMYTHSE